MTKETEYRNFAAICLDLAKGSTTESDKAHLVAMAEVWHELAERARHRHGADAGADRDPH